MLSKSNPSKTWIKVVSWWQWSIFGWFVPGISTAVKPLLLWVLSDRGRVTGKAHSQLGWCVCQIRLQQTHILPLKPSQHLKKPGRFFRKLESCQHLNLILVLMYCSLLSVPHTSGFGRAWRYSWVFDIHLTFILGGQQRIKYGCYESVLLGDEWTIFTLKLKPRQKSP